MGRLLCCCFSRFNSFACSTMVKSNVSFTKNIIILIGCTNLLYACYSFILANYRRRSATLINILVIANGFWCIICLIIIWWFWHEMTILAIMHIGGEAIFVATLAKFEYLWRNRLIVSDFIS